MTSAPAVSEQALVIHLYVTDKAYEQLRATWKACAETLGMTHLIAPLGLPDELPLDSADLPRSGAIAARQTRHGRSGQRQAIVRRHHEVLILSIALTGGAGTEWADLERAWESAVTPTRDWVLSEVQIFAAGHADTDDRAQLTAHLPGNPPPGPPVVVDGHTMLWETAGEPDSRPLRRIVAVTISGRSAESDAWLWSRGDDQLPPFARYLLHTGKIRYQLRVRDRYDQEVHIRTVADAADAATAEARHALLSGQGTLSELLDARTRLARGSIRSAGLVEVQTRLLEMSRTVEIAVSNMASLAEADLGGLFGDDRALAGWFIARLADDAHYLEAAARRIHEVLSALSMAIDGALDGRREELHRLDAATTLRRERLNLLQTAVIGSALMVLAAIQAFQYQISLPRPLVVPILASMGTATLLLATIALWVRSDHTALTWTGRIAGGFTCASFGWLAVTIIAHLTIMRPAPAALSMVISALAFTAGLLLSGRLMTRFPRVLADRDP